MEITKLLPEPRLQTIACFSCGTTAMAVVMLTTANVAKGITIIKIMLSTTLPVQNVMHRIKLSCGQKTIM